MTNPWLSAIACCLQGTKGRALVRRLHNEVQDDRGEKLTTLQDTVRKKGHKLTKLRDSSRSSSHGGSEGGIIKRMMSRSRASRGTCDESLAVDAERQSAQEGEDAACQSV